MKYFAVYLRMLNQEKSLEYRTQHLDYLAQSAGKEKYLPMGDLLMVLGD